MTNAGGAIGLLGVEMMGWSYAQAEKGVAEKIQGALRQVFDLAEKEGITTEAAAREMVKDRLRGAKEARPMRTPDAPLRRPETGRIPSTGADIG